MVVAHRCVDQWVASKHITLRAVWSGGLQTDSVVCSCTTDFYGPACDRFCHPFPTCNGHGSCAASDGRCECDPGYFGDNCEQFCDHTCNGNGQCVSSGKCACDAGYYGTFCEHRCFVSQCEANVISSDKIRAENSCDGILDIMSREINAVCCAGDDCVNGAPETCSEECSNVFVSFYRQCRNVFAGDDGMERFFMSCANRIFRSDFDGPTEVNAPIHSRHLFQFGQLWSVEDCAYLCVDDQYTDGRPCKGFYYSASHQRCLLTTDANEIAASSPPLSPMFAYAFYNHRPTTQHGCNENSPSFVKDL